MKLALFGSSPIALEAALRFHSHEAAITWFNGGEEEVDPLFSSASVGWEDCTSPLGWGVLKDSGDHGTFSWAAWKTRYYLPLVEFLGLHQVIRPHQVLSVSKRFLAPGEEIKGRSRFHDLFRVIYQLNPEEFINQQKETDPETYRRLSEEFIESLQSSLEMYEDFDLVLDLRHGSEPCSLAVTGRALGEGRIGKEHLRYGLRALEKSASYDVEDGIRELAVVGSDDLAAEMMINLERWLSDPRTRLFVVSAEENPFGEFLVNARPEVRNRFEGLLERMNAEFGQEAEEFHRKLREWQELDDFVQVKKPRPVEPIPRLVFFSGHNVTAVDQLIDKRRIFITLERPEWREGLRQPENNHLDLKTIGVDEVLAATGLVKRAVGDFLRPDEAGYFGYVPKRPSIKNGWKEDLNALQSIEEKVFELFSPAPAL